MFNVARHFRNALQPLVQRALELDELQRVAWLDDLRADCPGIVEELERLLRLALQASRPFDGDFTVSTVIPGSLEDLGLRC